MLKRQFVLVAAAVLGAASVASAQTLTPVRVEGNARDYLAQIPIPGSSAPEYFAAPSQADLAAWRSAVHLAWTGQADAAAYYADTVGYVLVELHDAVRGATYLIVREKAAPGQPGYRALGYCAFRGDARNRLIVQAPHPRSELYTETEAIDAFLQVPARALLVAGCHRQNSSTSSPCTDGTYRISDGSHWTGHFFAAAHETLVDEDPTSIAVQLHGYGTPDAEQFILSEGIAADPSPWGFLRQLEWRLETQEGYVALVYPTETQRLGATFNVQGRYSNGEKANPCGRSATRTLGTFVSVEQAVSVRKDPARFIRALAAATAERWP